MNKVLLVELILVVYTESVQRDLILVAHSEKIKITLTNNTQNSTGKEKKEHINLQ